MRQWDICVSLRVVWRLHVLRVGPGMGLGRMALNLQEVRSGGEHEPSDDVG